MYGRTRPRVMSVSRCQVRRMSMPESVSMAKPVAQLGERLVRELRMEEHGDGPLSVVRGPLINA